MKNPNNLLEDVKKCMTDPISDILLNFSIEKSRKGYDERVKQWESWSFRQNPAVEKEEVSFDFGSLSELWLVTTQAHNLYVNLKREDFNKWVDWCIYGQNIVVSWYRLKSFDEWLHDWLKDALVMAIDCPEDWARMVVEKGLGEGKYTKKFCNLSCSASFNNKSRKISDETKQKIQLSLLQKNSEEKKNEYIIRKKTEVFTCQWFIFPMEQLKKFLQKEGILGRKSPDP